MSVLNSPEKVKISLGHVAWLMLAMGIVGIALGMDLENRADLLDDPEFGEEIE